MTILQASFFWKNNQPGGLGVTFGPPSFSSSELEMMFDGPVSKKFMQDSDNALGTCIVNDMLNQLTSISHAQMRGESLTSRMIILAALNILWLSSRGFIPNDEFNGVQFISHLPIGMPSKENKA